jgi:hypothetical protein
VTARMTRDLLRFAVKALVVIGVGGAAVAAHAEPDLGKKACAHEARQLCPAEMKTLSRKRVEACMIAKIEQTSPICHAAMLRIKAEREAIPKR